MADRIRVVIVEPNENPREEFIENELNVFQDIVGGYIECLRIGNGLMLVCNDEGKLIGLPKNRRLKTNVYDDVIVGTFFVTKDDGEGDFASLSTKDIIATNIMFGLGKE